MKKAVFIALFGLTILISSSSALSGIKETIRDISYDHWSETRRIEVDEYFVFKFQGTQTNIVDISIEVVTGDSIDMFLFSSENFTEYQSMMRSGRPKPYNPYSSGKGMNMKYVNYSFEIPADGLYYIVEDNTFLPNNGGQPGGYAVVKTTFARNRCLECEEAALELRKRAEEANRLSEEAQRKLQEEMNLSKGSQPAPGFEMIFSVAVLAAFYLSGRKKMQHQGNK